MHCLKQGVLAFDADGNYIGNFINSATFDDSLVYLTHSITVWTGTTTEQTGCGEGSKSMVRRRIVPASSLKPFTDLRNKVKRFCETHGEKYLGGYVFMHKDLSRLENFMNCAKNSFYFERDRKFASSYNRFKAERDRGETPEGCSPGVVVPPLCEVLPQISFEFAIFPMGRDARGQRVSMFSFLDSLVVKMTGEAKSLLEELEAAEAATEGHICRAVSLSRKLHTWQRFRRDFATACQVLRAVSADKDGRPLGQTDKQQLQKALSVIVRLPLTEELSGPDRRSDAAGNGEGDDEALLPYRDLIRRRLAGAGIDWDGLSGIEQQSFLQLLAELAKSDLPSAQVAGEAGDPADVPGESDESWDCSVESLLSRPAKGFFD